MRWAKFTFSISFDNQSVRWWVDVCLADKVVSNIIQKHEKYLEAWRIHRRALNDATGHQFSFFIFTTEDMIKEIDKNIKDNEIYKLLIENKIIIKMRDETNSVDNKYHNLAGYSDPKWPVQLKETWPFFAQGFSKMYLELLKRCEIEKEIDIVKLDDIENKYISISQRFNEMWSSNGNHAFFHHLNALFGYHPVLLKPLKVDGYYVTF